MNYIILPTKSGDYISELLQKTDNACVLDTATVRQSDLHFADSDRVYMPSDAVYAQIDDRFSTERQQLLNSMRDKHAFRQRLTAIDPDFYFAQMSLADLASYNFAFCGGKRYVVKPVVGFMAGGVRIFDQTSDLQLIANEVASELEAFAQLYPSLFSTDVIVEEYVDGQEYAVDMYYDSCGCPHIMNIYCHPEAKRHEYQQMLYYTNEKIFKAHQQQFIDYFTKFNATKDIVALPVHAEFKITTNDKVMPIEFNASRFGGMGLADLSYYAFNVLPVDSYFNERPINWSQVWAKNGTKTFCWLLCYNGADINIKHAKPCYQKLLDLLPKSLDVIKYEELAYQTSPAFGVLYAAMGDEALLQELLAIEFNDCFIGN